MNDATDDCVVQLTSDSSGATTEVTVLVQSTAPQSSSSQYDSVSEWLRRWTRNPLGSARAGSNPAAVAIVLSYCQERVSEYVKTPTVGLEPTTIRLRA